MTDAHIVTRKTQAAGGVVLNSDGLVLVVNQKGNSWSLPKGHIDEGEDEMTAARREVVEESGISELQLLRPLGSYDRYRISLDGGDDLSELKTIHMFLFTTTQMTLAPQDPENPEARWVDRNEVADLLTHRKDKEFFTSVLPQLPQK